MLKCPVPEVSYIYRRAIGGAGQAGRRRNIGNIPRRPNAAGVVESRRDMYLTSGTGHRHIADDVWQK
jgi:hypothetical protein